MHNTEEHPMDALSLLQTVVFAATQGPVLLYVMLTEADRYITRLKRATRSASIVSTTRPTATCRYGRRRAMSCRASDSAVKNTTALSSAYALSRLRRRNDSISAYCPAMMAP